MFFLMLGAILLSSVAFGEDDPRLQQPEVQQWIASFDAEADDVMRGRGEEVMREYWRLIAPYEHQEMEPEVRRIMEERARTLAIQNVRQRHQPGTAPAVRERPTTPPARATPPRTIQPQRNHIRVDDPRYDGLSDTERIDRAIADAHERDAQLVFGNRVYNYEGRLVLNHPVNWLGTQGEVYDPQQTHINITRRWTFAGRGASSIKGIAIHGNRSFTGSVVEVHRFVREITFDNCHFMGALHEKNSDVAVILAVAGNAGSVKFLNGSLSDAHSTSPIETRSTTGGTAGGWRLWPCVRAFNASGFDGYLEMRNVDIFDIGHEVTYENGQMVWQRETGSISPGGWDIDAWQRSGREGTGRTVMENVRFRSCPGTFIKISEHGGRLEWDNIQFHVRAGEPVAGRLVRLQSSGSGFQRNGFIRNTRITVDRARDLSRMGGGHALHMLMSFSGTRPEETLHIENTIVEIGRHDPNPEFLRRVAVFGYHRSTSPKHNLIIENTQLHVPGGMEFFFRTSADAQNSPDNARNRVNDVTFINNTNLGRVSHFYYAWPHRASCSNNRVYTYHQITLKGDNSYRDMSGRVHHVQPAVAEPHIWMHTGSPFADCGKRPVEMFLFDIRRGNADHRPSGIAP